MNESLRQLIVKRKYTRKNVADPLMCTEYYDDVPESDEEFINRVTNIARDCDHIINISYLNEDTAIIIHERDSGRTDYYPAEMFEKYALYNGTISGGGEKL